MLNEIKKDLLVRAKRLGDYTSFSVDELLNNYCDLKDKGDHRQDYYFSALALIFWPWVKKFADKSPNIGLEMEDFFSWECEGIEYACKYRAWQDETKKISGTACVNQCMNTIRLQHYYEYNLDKHRANYGVISLDSQFDNDDDNSNTLLDTLVDEADVQIKEVSEGTNMAVSYIQSYINKNKIIEAIILDLIAFNDVEKHTKKTIKNVQPDGSVKKHRIDQSEFWAYKLVQLLGNLPEDYKKYFEGKYQVSGNLLDVALEQVGKCNNQKLYKYLRTCLANCRADFE